MAKKHKKGGGRGKAPQTQAAPPPPPRKGILRCIASLLLPTGWMWTSVGLIVALVTSYFEFRPQITVEPDNTIDPAQVMMTPFRITNSGKTPIYNVRRRCFPRQIEGGRLQIYSRPDAVVFMDSYPIVPVLSHGESTSVSNPMNNFRNMETTDGDIEMVVDYSIAIIQIHQEKNFRFATRRCSNNEIMWFHKAISE